MSVLDAVEDIIRSNTASDFEAELARALATQIDKGEGTASAAKELRILIGNIEDRKPEADGLDELARKRDARRAV